MSMNAQKLLKRNRRLCACGTRALFVRPSNGHVAWRRDHDVCGRCWRAFLESEHAGGLRAGGGTAAAGAGAAASWGLAA